jgi:hypothetical protein
MEMADLDLHAELRTLDRTWGNEARILIIGDRHVRIEGLDVELADALDRRWGAFLGRPAGEMADYTMRILRVSRGGWLKHEGPSEQYRIEAVNDAESRVIISYHFALCAEEDPAIWRVAVADQSSEPLERILDNATRFVVARLAIESGGFALHGAAVLHDGRAYLFAGPSRSGKSTAVALAAPALSMGDDFALVVRGRNGWAAPALPFDNSERIETPPPRGLHPVAGIWRLHQSEITRLEHPVTTLGVASLMGCTAFSWALPELSGDLLEQVKGLVLDGLFAHLHFSKNTDIWAALLAGEDSGG